MKQRVNLEAVLSETILASVIAALSTDQYASAPDKPVGRDDKVIGELTPFEKALFTVKGEIADSYNKLVEAIEKNGEKVDSTMVAKRRISKDTFEAIDSLFWASINSRLGEKAYQGDSIAIRKGFQIVQRKQIDDFKNFLLSGLLKAIEDSNPHDCETCPDYDECDLPIKKPRV
jgi:hypothetical protein